MNIVFLGGGRITSAMIAGLRLAGSKGRLIVHDRNRNKLRDLKRRYSVIAEPSLDRAVASADMLVVAVRPVSVRDLLKTFGEIRRPVLAVSVVAGIPLRTLSKLLPPPVRWSRAMPSPLCRTTNGLTAITFSRTLSHKDRQSVRNFFGSVGSVIQISEHKFDAFTVTFSCSHGYHALDALASAGRAAGLDRETALLASAHALADGIVTWRDGQHSLEALLTEAATPGGVAAATASAMDAVGYRQAIKKGVAAGLRQARANARL